jgi:hypothetical protein
MKAAIISHAREYPECDDEAKISDLDIAIAMCRLLVTKRGSKL